jgi:hypothetical protein
MCCLANAERGVCLVCSLLLPRDIRPPLIWRISRSAVALDLHSELVVCGARYYHGIPDNSEHESWNASGMGGFIANLQAL